MAIQTQKKARMSLEDAEDFLRLYDVSVKDLRVSNTLQRLPYIDQNDAEASYHRVWFEDLRRELQEGAETGIRIRGIYVTQAKCGSKGADSVWQPAEPNYWPIDLEVRL